jgi:hypothetical protein
MLRLLLMLAVSELLLPPPPNSFREAVKQADGLSLKLTDPRKDELFPASKDYAAVLANDGSRPVSIEAVQMPGGYAGSGRFFACSLQFWRASSRQWVTPRPAKLLDFGETTAPIVKVGLDPGKVLEVCTSLLPQQQGHVGDSVRFALSLQWGQKPTVFSKMFTITGDGDDVKHK